MENFAQPGPADQGMQPPRTHVPVEASVVDRFDGLGRQRHWHIETMPPVMLVAVQPLAPKSAHQSWRTLAPFESVKFRRETFSEGG